MPRRREKQRNCGGYGCGENGCDTCLGESDDEYYLPYKPGTRRGRRGLSPAVSDCKGCGCERKGCVSCKEWSGSSVEDDDDGDDGGGGGDHTERCDGVSKPRRGERRPVEGLEDEVGYCGRGENHRPSGSSSRRDSGRKRRRMEEGDGGDYDEEEWEEEYDGDNYDGDFDGRDDYEEGDFDEEEDHVEGFDDGASGAERSPAAGEPSFKDMVDALSEQTARDTLVRLASMAPSAQVAIRQAYAQQIKEPVHRLVDWDFLSKKAWHLLYTSREAELYGTASAERRGRLARRIRHQIYGHVMSMCRRTHTPFANKLSALATARKIIKSVLLGGPGSLAGAVRDGLRSPGDTGTGGQALMAAIQWVLVHMTQEEKIRAGGTFDEKGTLLEKYIWCRDKARQLGPESLKQLDQVVMDLDVPANN